MNCIVHERNLPGKENYKLIDVLCKILFQVLNELFGKFSSIEKETA